MSRDYPKRPGVRDPSSHRTPEQIRKLSRGYNSTPRQIRLRSMRNQARDRMKDELGASALKGKDVDHRKRLDQGGTNARSNLRLQTPAKNRAWAKRA